MNSAKSNRVSYLTLVLAATHLPGVLAQTPKANWDTPQDVMQWIAFPDGVPAGGVTGITTMTEGTTSFVRIDWKALNVGPIFATPGNFSFPNAATLPAVFSPSAYNAITLTVRQTMSFDTALARWIPRNATDDEVFSLKWTTKVPIDPTNTQWEQVILKLDATPYWRPSQDVVYAEFMLAPSNITSLSDLEARYRKLPAGSYLDIAKIDFVNTGGPTSVTITDFSPKRGSRGDLVTIKGLGFGVPIAQNVVLLGQAPQQVLSGDSSTLVFKANGSGLSIISVLVPGGGQAVSSQPFLFLGSPRSFSKLAGDNQTAPVGTALQPFSVKITDMSGQGLPGLNIAWTVVSGSGSVSSRQSTTDDNGVASTVLTLGQTPGIVKVSAEPDAFNPVVFTVTATR